MQQLLKAGGYDVGSGRFVLSSAMLGPRVLAAYRRAEQARAHQLNEFLTSRAIPYATIGAGSEIRPRLVELTEVFARAG